MTRLLVLLGVFCLIGCGGGGGSTTAPPSSAPTTSSATMQTGQWEFAATPSTGSKPIYFELNLTGSNAGIGSTVFNTGLFQFGGQVGGLFADCGNWETSNAVNSSGAFSGTLSSPGSTPPENQVALTGTLATNGQAVAEGTYSAPESTLCSLVSGPSTGTLSGYTVTPLNGTFSGTLTGTSAGPDQITIQVSQDANFGITATGTSVQNLVTTSLSIVPAGSSTDNTGGYSNVIGATVQGSGTSSNINGTSTFQVFGHFNAAGTQIQIVSFGQSGTETGTLTKQ
jgi:hypothetical protein